MKGEVEVGQRFLQFQHAEEFFVLQRFPHLRFDAVRLFINLLQEVQEGRRCGRQYLEKESCLFIGLERGVIIIYKLLDHCIILKTHGDKYLVCNKNPQRQCIVSICFKDDRRIYDNENKIVFQFHVGTFFTVKSGLEGIDGDAGKGIQLFQLRRIGSRAIDPRPFFHFLKSDGTKSVVFIMFISGKHRTPSFPYKRKYRLPLYFHNNPTL